MNRYFLIIYIFLCLYSSSNGQTLGDYRNAIQNGNWNDPATWEIFDGTTWVAATQKPALNDDVYLNFDAQVSLTQTESCRNLYLNGDTGTNTVLFLSDFTLEVFDISKMRLKMYFYDGIVEQKLEHLFQQLNKFRIKKAKTHRRLLRRF